MTPGVGVAVSVRRGSVGAMEAGHAGWSWGLRSGRSAHRAGSWNDEWETGAGHWLARNRAD